MNNVVPLRGSQSTLPSLVNIEAEQAVLGAMMSHASVIELVSTTLGPEHFGEELHRRIFEVVVALYRNGGDASPVSVKTFLGDHDLGDLTSSQYLARLAASAVPGSVVGGYARQVLELYQRREIHRIGTDAIARAADLPVSVRPSDLAVEVADAFQGVVADDSTGVQIEHGGGATAEIVEYADNVRTGKIALEMVSTGFTDIDNVMGGYEPGTVVVIAGRPGMGKTISMNCLARRAAIRGAGVLEISLEVGRTQTMARHLADASYTPRLPIEFRNIMRGALTEEEIDRVRQCQIEFGKLPIWIDCSARLTVAQVAERVRRTRRGAEKNGTHLAVVLIDHLDFLQATDRYSGNRTQEIGEIMLGLKAISKREGVCIVLLSQLNRAVEQRAAKDRRPTLADLRNSGDIEQVADVVTFLYREEYYAVRTPEYIAGDPDASAAAVRCKNSIEMIFAKTRAGPTMTVNLWCDVACSTMAPASRGY